MKIDLDCLSCILKMASRNARLITKDIELQRKIMIKVIKSLESINWDSIPIEFAFIVNKVITEVTGNPDPFRELRKKSNDMVLKIYPELKRIIESSVDKLETAVKLSAAGNSIDFGAYVQPDLHESIEKAVKESLVINDYGDFREKVLEAEDMIYFLDNAGEIVFDKLLIETMLDVRSKPFRSITLVVKGGPAMGDVIPEDVRYVGLDKLPNVRIRCVSNGTEGTGPWMSSEIVRGWIKEHDLRVFKGQANFEVYDDEADSFFILMVKCPIIAKMI
ncbi:MAG TPA: DUF89 family protein, partial [Nitrososphaeria archaeon]|nr:DUF89 family protein [Nitrososphaeria archaeon]